MTILSGCVTWPKDFADQYQQKGYWQGETFGAVLTKKARENAQSVAIVDSYQQITYAELNQKSLQLAEGLHHLGIKAQDRVVLQLPNRVEFFVVLFALFRLGAIPILALPNHRTSEITQFCQTSEAVAYIIPDVYARHDYRAQAEKVLQQTSYLQHVIVVGDAGDYISFDKLFIKSSSPSYKEPNSQDVAFLQLSGGSTAIPKLIPRTHDDYIYSIRASVEICGINSYSKFLCVLPAAHNFPLSSPGSLGVLYAGGTVVLAPDPSPDTAFSLIAKEKISFTCIVPHIALVWLQAASQRKFDLSSLEFLQVGGSKLSEEVARRIQPILGCKLQQVFGMAEGLVCYTRLDDDEETIIKTQGLPISTDDEIRIVDDEDHPVSSGNVGHLLTRGPYTIRGYYKSAEHNQIAFTTDGFYRTGDMVRQTESGYLIVEGRNKDQINRGGEKISAEEIENHILAHPNVHDVAIVAMPDTYLGERSCAFIIPFINTKITLQELRRFLRQRELAEYKIPDHIKIVNNFPQTNVGKVNKKRLREMIMTNEI